MGNKRDTQYSRDAQAQAKQLAAPSRSLSMKAVVLAAVLALIAAVAFVGAMGRTANAYIPYDAGENGTGGKPTITAEMKNPASFVGAGQFHTYNGSVTFDNVDPNAGGTYTVTVNADELLPFTSKISTANTYLAELRGAKVTNIDVKGPNPNSTQVTYTLKPNSGIDQIYLEFRMNSKMPSEVPEATPVYGSIAGKYEPTTQVRLEPWTRGEGGPYGANNSDFKDLQPPAGSCTGTAKFAYKMPDGGYLMDIKFADARGDNSVQFTKDPVINFYQGNRAIDANKIEFPAGEKVAPDPTPPYYGNSDPIVAAHPKARWLDSWNWEYDPKYSTGLPTTADTSTTWVPAGTKLTIEREFKYTRCIGGVPTDGNIDLTDTMIANVEIGKNAVPVEDNAVISFVTPGDYNAPKQCENIWSSEAYQRGQGGAINKVGYWEGWPGALTFHETNAIVQDENGRPQDSHAVATYGEGWLGGKLWYLVDGSAKNTLAWADLSTPNLQAKNIQTTGGPAEGFAGALAFDKNGYIYAVSSKTSNPSLWRMNLKDNENGPYRWEMLIEELDNEYGFHSGFEVKDLVVDYDGNVIITSRNGNVSYVYLVPHSKVEQRVKNYKAKHFRFLFDGKEGTRAVFGLAFGPDGELYASDSGGSLWKLDKSVMRPDGTGPKGVDNIGAKKVGQNQGSGDLASCNYGKVRQPPKDGLEILKSAVDPVTGIIAEPGAVTTPNRVSFKNGVAKVNYVVSVVNKGTDILSSFSFKDTFNIPNGTLVQKVIVDGTELTNSDVRTSGSKGSFNLTTSDISGHSGNGKNIQSFNIEIVFNLDDPSSLPAGECKENDESKGFYNKVDHQKDEDKTNNSGCVPFEKPGSAKLRLVKQLVNSNGDPISQDDASAFQLTAGTPMLTDPDNPDTVYPNVPGFTGAGYVPSKTSYKTVVPGTYQLSEGVVSGKEAIAGKYAPYENWVCDSNKTVDAKGRLTLENDDEVECVIKNTPTTAYVEKLPKTAAGEGDDGAGNPHWGAPAEVNADGELMAKYIIRVKSLANGELLVNTGPIKDQFTVPAGLIWDGDKKATITAVPGNANSEAKLIKPADTVVDRDLVQEFTQLQMNDGVTIVDDIHNLKRYTDGTENYYKFEVSIPLKIDETATANGTSNKFRDNYENLKTCQASAAGGGKYVDTGKGIVNTVSMDQEDQSYSEHWEDDNRACIPVKIDPKWAVQKLAKSTGGSGWSKTGDTLSPTVEGGKQKVTAQYRVTVTNTGQIPDKQPVVSDTVTLNGGFKVESMKVERVTFNETGEVTSREDVNASDIDPAPGTGSNTVGFKIPAKDGLVNAGDSVEYLVTVVGVRSGEPAEGTAKNVQKCQDGSNGGYQSNLGLHNKVALEGVDDSDGEENNEACIPVQPSNKKIQVLKFSGGDDPQPIVGAEFVVYPDNGGQPDTSKGSALTVIEEAGKKTHKFESAELVAGKDYWLKETKAPSGNELLPEAVKFGLSNEGVKLYAKNGTGQETEALGGSFKLDSADNGNAFAIKVYDPRVMELPKSGGMGRWPMVGVGVLLFMLSTLYMMKTSGVSRRRD